MGRNRRLLLGLAATIFLAACNTVVPYRDQASKNLTVALGEVEGGFATAQSIALHVTGDESRRDDNYLGVIDLDRSVQQVGLPEGEDLVLVLVFAENNVLMSSGGTSSVRIPVHVRPGQKYRLDVSKTREGFTYDLKRAG